MKSYKKPVSCSVSGTSVGVIPFLAGALVGGMVKAAAIGAAAAAGAAVGSKLAGDGFSIGLKPVDASPVKLGVV